MIERRGGKAGDDVPGAGQYMLYPAASYDCLIGLDGPIGCRPNCRRVQHSAFEAWGHIVHDLCAGRGELEITGDIFYINGIDGRGRRLDRYLVRARIGISRSSSFRLEGDA
jgi:hypothetical protein